MSIQYFSIGLFITDSSSHHGNICVLIFVLFSEIILFLHQIFYKGLSKKLENWPTFYTGKIICFSSRRIQWISSGDLFDMFISMLHIYLEYVRNHHYSLQVK